MQLPSTDGSGCDIESVGRTFVARARAAKCLRSVFDRAIILCPTVYIVVYFSGATVIRK